VAPAARLGLRLASTGTVGVVRQLLPEPLENVDPSVLHASHHRSSPRHRPWVALNMVASIDGATQVEGRSGGLGGPADREMFLALRSIADVILVAAGTVRTERYGPPTSTPQRREERLARGQTDTPRLAIVSGSLDLDLEAPLFTEATQPPLVITAPPADPSRAGDVARVAELVLAGDGGRVDLAVALSELSARGVDIVLAEGGPSLNGQLCAGQVVDELNLSVSPVIAGPGAKGLTSGPPQPAPVNMRLSHVLTADGFLFLRYVSD